MIVFGDLKDGDILIGSPGPYNWRGTVFSNTLHSNLSVFRMWHQSPVEDLAKDQQGPGPATGYYSYLGETYPNSSLLLEIYYIQVMTFPELWMLILNMSTNFQQALLATKIVDFRDIWNFWICWSDKFPIDKILANCILKLGILNPQ